MTPPGRFSRRRRAVWWSPLWLQRDCCTPRFWPGRVRVPFSTLSRIPTGAPRSFYCAIWVRICHSWLKRGFLLFLLTWMETQSAGQRSYYLCKKWAVKYMAHNLGQGLRSGNTDSRCVQGFTTNPKPHWLSTSGCSPGSQDYSGACSALNPHISNGRAWGLTVPN